MGDPTHLQIILAMLSMGLIIFLSFITIFDKIVSKKVSKETCIEVHKAVSDKMGELLGCAKESRDNITVIKQDIAVMTQVMKNLNDKVTPIPRKDTK